MSAAQVIPERRMWEQQAPVVLAAVATVLMLEGVRVFVAYLVFVVDQANRVALGGTALGVFAAIGLGGVVARLGRQNALLASAAGLGLARLVLQFLQGPEARVVLGAATVICWGWLVIALLRWHRSAAALGIPLGLALDLAIRIATGTVDLPWMPGAPEHFATVVVVAVFALATAATMRMEAIDEGGAAFALLALGPGLAVFHLITGNLSYAQVETGRDFPSSAALLLGGSLLGVVFVLLEPWLERTKGPDELVWLALAVAGIVAYYAFSGGSPSVALVLGAIASIVLLSLALGENSNDIAPRFGRLAAYVTIGMLVHAMLLFGYYTYTGKPVIAVVTWIAFAVLALPVGRNRSRTPESLGSASRALPVSIVVVIGLLTCGWQWLRYDEVEAGAPLGAEFTVMTYNIQSGFAVDNVWSLEQTARTIEAADPDIVVLQEVGRGWLVTTNIDQIEWLSQRLSMQYAFGANSQDGLWGNAILSRAPILDSERHAFDTTQNLDRAVIAAEIATETGSLWVLGTHLDNPSGAGNVRLEQAEQLIEFWEGRSPALLLGDLNATPDTEVLAALDTAGFRDPGLEFLDFATTSEDGLRIDYILTTAGLTTTEMDIPQVWTSDHLPVVARVRLSAE